MVFESIEARLTSLVHEPDDFTAWRRLGALPSLPEITSFMLDALNSEESLVRLRAVQYFGSRLKPSCRFREEYTVAASDESWAVRKEVVHTLTGIAACSNDEVSQMRSKAQLTIMALEDAHQLVRAEAIKSLKLLNDEHSTST